MLAVSGCAVAREASVIDLPLLPLLPLFPLLEGLLPFFFLRRLEHPWGSNRRTDEPTAWDQRTITDEPIFQPILICVCHLDRIHVGVQGCGAHIHLITKILSQVLKAMCAVMVIR